MATASCRSLWVECKQLDQSRLILSNVPFVSLTATATEKGICSNMINSLNLKDPYVAIGSFDCNCDNCITRRKERDVGREAFLLMTCIKSCRGNWGLNTPVDVLRGSRRSFSECWNLIEKEVIEPRNCDCRLLDKHPKQFYRYDLEPFRVRRKDFCLLSAVEKLLNKFIPALSHDANGLSFQFGMVVDLTNTDRYYSRSEFKKEGLKYLKIRCQGRDAVPDAEAVNTFVFEVAQYISNQIERQTKKRVFLHCTHGHNRTGYMIVHYLMRTQQASSVTEAIQKFADARPPGIYKQDYIDSLYTFYHETKLDVVVCPSTREWKRSSDFDLNGEAVPEDDDGVPYSSLNEKKEESATMTIDDVLGDKIPDEQEIQMRRFCLEMLRLPAPTRGHSPFPGSHPVSLDRENLQLLRQRYYYATWKADGTRYMLLLLADGCYLVDRNFKFRRVQMRFPCKNMTDCHQFTLLDGEMIIDTISPKKQERRYLIYDMIAINRVSIAERPFSERWNLIEKEVIESRNCDRRPSDKHPKQCYRYDLEPFRVRRKDFYLLSAVEKLLNKFIPALSHDADGLIFQAKDKLYCALLEERMKLDRVTGTALYSVCGDATMKNIVLVRPSTGARPANIDGVNQHFLVSHGDHFLQTFRNMSQLNLSLDGEMNMQTLPTRKVIALPSHQRELAPGKHEPWQENGLCDQKKIAFRCEVDFKPDFSGGATWAAANVVVFYEDVVIIFFSRAFFVRDSYHGESLSALLGAAALLKLKAFPSDLYSDNQGLVTDLQKKYVGNRNCGEILRRICRILSYTNDQDLMFKKIASDDNRPAHVLGSLYKAAAADKQSYISRCWDDFLCTFRKPKNGQFVRYSTKIKHLEPGIEGSLRGLTWYPDSVAVRMKRMEKIPRYYSVRCPVKPPEDVHLLRGVDFRHWHVILDPSFGSKDDSAIDLLDMYVKLLGRVVGSEDKAKSKIYSAVFDRYFAFGCLLDHGTAEVLESGPGVLVVLPDFFTVPVLQDYGGVKVDHGIIVARPAHEQQLVDDAEDEPAKLSGAELIRMSREERLLRELEEREEKMRNTAFWKAKKG